jgi:hypothetical protein
MVAGGPIDHSLLSTSTAEEIEDGSAASDQNATLLAVFEDTCVVKVTVQGSKDLGLTYHGV